MKRHFLAGFMAFCVGAMSLSTVSCGKLEDGLNELNEKVEKLEERIKNLEDKLTAQADAITKLEAKVAVVGVEKKDGNVILTLANGEKVTVTEQKTVGSVTWGKTNKGWISMKYVK